MKKMLLLLLILCPGTAFAGMTIDQSYTAPYGKGNMYFPQQTTSNSFYVPERPVNMFSVTPGSNPYQTESRSYLEYNGTERPRSCTETETSRICF